MAAERGFIELGTVWGARLGGYHDFRFRGEDRTVSRRNSQHFTVFDGLASIRGRLRAKTFYSALPPYRLSTVLSAFCP
jgi:hypothetical protein